MRDREHYINLTMTLWSIPAIRIPLNVFLHMRTPIFLGMRATVQMPFVGETILVEFRWVAPELTCQSLARHDRGFLPGWQGDQV